MRGVDAGANGPAKKGGFAVRLLALSVVAIAVVTAGPAIAGPATEALGRCLTMSSTGGDRIALVRWVYLAMSAHPEVGGASSSERRKDVLTAAGASVQRLLTQACRAEARAAIQQDGPAALGQAFKAFGRVAMTELMADPKVLGELAAIQSFVDEKRLSEAFGPPPK